MGQAMGLGRKPAAQWDPIPTPVQAGHCWFLSKDWELPGLFSEVLVGGSTVLFFSLDPLIPEQNSHWFACMESISWITQSAWEADGNKN